MILGAARGGGAAPGDPALLLRRRGRPPPRQGVSVHAVTLPVDACGMTSSVAAATAGWEDALLVRASSQLSAVAGRPRWVTPLWCGEACLGEQGRPGRYTSSLASPTRLACKFWSVDRALVQGGHSFSSFIGSSPEPVGAFANCGSLWFARSATPRPLQHVQSSSSQSALSRTLSSDCNFFATSSICVGAVLLQQGFGVSCGSCALLDHGVFPYLGDKTLTENATACHRQNSSNETEPLSSPSNLCSIARMLFLSAGQ